jgi:hypothetical protein
VAVSPQSAITDFDRAPLVEVAAKVIRTQDLAIRRHSAGASWDTFLSGEGFLVVAIAGSLLLFTRASRHGPWCRRD